MLAGEFHVEPKQGRLRRPKIEQEPNLGEYFIPTIAPTSKSSKPLTLTAELDQNADGLDGVSAKDE
jgi:hypothetical protein